MMIGTLIALCGVALLGLGMLVALGGWVFNYYPLRLYWWVDKLLDVGGLLCLLGILIVVITVALGGVK